MKAYEDLEVGDFVKLPKGTKVFLLSCQLNVLLHDDEVIKITAKCYPDTIGFGFTFGFIETIIFHDFHDKANCEISFRYSDAVDLEPKDFPPPLPYLDIIYSPE